MNVDLSRLQSTRNNDRRSWHGSAFIVEALVLLAFLVATLAILMQLMGLAQSRGVEADKLSSAIVLASNDAETFSADPAQGSQETYFLHTQGQLAEVENIEANEGRVLSVMRTVEETPKPAGTLYLAHIVVSSNGEVIYELDTARYASGKEVQP